MGTIVDYINNIDLVISGLRSETDAIVMRNKAKILDLNRIDQLFDYGINSDGKSLKKYKPITIQYKMESGATYAYTTLKDTGRFYDGFDLLKRGEFYSIFSRDSKSADLMDKYGNNIFGLTKDNEQVLNYQILKPEIDAFCKKYL